MLFLWVDSSEAERVNEGRENGIEADMELDELSKLGLGYPFVPSLPILGRGASKLGRSGGTGTGGACTRDLDDVLEAPEALDVIETCFEAAENRLDARE